MRFELIAHIFEVFSWKRFVDRFDFLQQGNIRLRLFKPFCQSFDPGLDAVDIERGDFHTVPFWLVRISRQERWMCKSKTVLGPKIAAMLR